jgi:hypothetical protein
LILALKLVVTPALIAAATLVGRRFGPSISGWLVGLPFTSGPVSLFLTLEDVRDGRTPPLSGERTRDAGRHLKNERPRMGASSFDRHDRSVTARVD